MWPTRLDQVEGGPGTAFRVWRRDWSAGSRILSQFPVDMFLLAKLTRLSTLAKSVTLKKTQDSCYYSCRRNKSYLSYASREAGVGPRDATFYFLLRGCYPELLPARNHGMFGVDVDSTRTLMPKLCNRQVIITNGNWVSIDSRLFASLATQKARCKRQEGVMLSSPRGNRTHHSRRGTEDARIGYGGLHYRPLWEIMLRLHRAYPP